MKKIINVFVNSIFFFDKKIHQYKILNRNTSGYVSFFEKNQQKSTL